MSSGNNNYQTDAVSIEALNKFKASATNLAGSNLTIDQFAAGAPGTQGALSGFSGYTSQADEQAQLAKFLPFVNQRIGEITQRRQAPGRAQTLLGGAYGG